MHTEIKNSQSSNSSTQLNTARMLLSHQRTKYVVGVILLFSLLTFFAVAKSEHNEHKLENDFTYVVKTPNLLKETLSAKDTKNETLSKLPNMEEAEMLEKNGHIDEALTQYYALYTKDPHNVDYLKHIARLLEKKESWTSAFEAYKKLSSLEKNNPDFSRGLINTQLHNYTNTLSPTEIEVLHVLIQSLPDSIEEKSYFSCVLSLYTETDTKEICRNLENSQSQKYKDVFTSIAEKIQRYETQRDGHKSYLSMLYAGILADEGWYTLSTIKAKQVLLNQREYRDAWILIGFNLIRLKKYQEALFYLEEAYKKDTTKVHVQYLLGVAHDHLGNKEKAISYYTIALKNKFSDSAQIVNRIGELYIALGKYREALEITLQYARTTSTQTPTSYITPLWILLELEHNPRSAMDLATEGKKKFPNDSLMDGIHHWTTCYLEENNSTALSALVEKAYMFPEQSTLTILATRCALHLKKRKEAEELIHLLEQHATSEETQRYIQDLSTLLNNL